MHAASPTAAALPVWTKLSGGGTDVAAMLLRTNAALHGGQVDAEVTFGRALKKARSLKLSLKVTVVDGANLSGTAAKSITLKR